MKKYLIRAGFNPYESGTVSPDDCVWRTYVGGNSGNLMFAYGVMNTLQTEGTELSYDYKWSFTDQEIEEINSTYDAYILPMADAFRPGFQKQLTGLTSMIKKLSIPVVVIGCAVRTDYEPDFSNGFVFDEIARDFTKAILEKGTILGVRGEITAQYLSYLGFQQERDFTTIGCPSLYTYGLATKTRNLPDKIERMVINTNGYYNVGYINEFLLNTIDSIPNYYLVQQIQAEFRDMYIGKRWLPALLSKRGDKSDKMIIKGKRLQELYSKDRVRYFFDVPSWVNFMHQFDLFVGNRFHGSVAAILAGVPHIMLPFNARTRELTEYHHLTSLKPDEVREGTSVVDYIDRLDFQSFNAHQEENLHHYIEFLNKNGLEHIFTDRTEYKIGESPLEKKLQKTTGKRMSENLNIVHCYNSLNSIGKIRRTLSVNLKGLKRENFKAAIGKIDSN